MYYFLTDYLTMAICDLVILPISMLQPNIEYTHCKNGNLYELKKTYTHLYDTNQHIQINRIFNITLLISAIKHNKIHIVKWLYSLPQIKIKKLNEMYVLLKSCCKNNKYLKILMWIFRLPNIKRLFASNYFTINRLWSFSMDLFKISIINDSSRIFKHLLYIFVPKYDNFIREHITSITFKEIESTTMLQYIISEVCMFSQSLFQYSMDAMALKCANWIVQKYPKYCKLIAYIDNENTNLNVLTQNNDYYSTVVYDMNVTGNYDVPLYVYSIATLKHIIEQYKYVYLPDIWAYISGVRIDYVLDDLKKINTNECCCCYSPCSAEIYMIKTNCNHIYCFNCWLSWFHNSQSNHSYTCAMCRAFVCDDETICYETNYLQNSIKNNEPFVP